MPGLPAWVCPECGFANESDHCVMCDALLPQRPRKITICYNALRADKDGLLKQVDTLKRRLQEIETLASGEGE